MIGLLEIFLMLMPLFSEYQVRDLNRPAPKRMECDACTKGARK